VNSFWEWKLFLRGIAMTANLRGHTGLISGRRAVDYLRPHLEGRRIEDCRNPRLGIAVSNLRTRRAEIVQRGPLLDFMIATCAMPVVIAARKIEGQHYWDGALGDPAPITHWLDDPQIETILIHRIISKAGHGAPPDETAPSIHQAFDRGFQVMNNRVAELSIQLARQAGKRVEIIETRSPRPVFHQSQSKRHQLIEAGQRSAAASRDRLSSLRPLETVI
jgi:NTE family protein